MRPGRWIELERGLELQLRIGELLGVELGRGVLHERAVIGFLLLLELLRGDVLRLAPGVDLRLLRLLEQLQRLGVVGDDLGRIGEGLDRIVVLLVEQGTLADLECGGVVGVCLAVSALASLASFQACWACLRSSGALVSSGMICAASA